MSHNISDEREAKRILSIQSSVVHGYVGNRSATFPLQLQGYDVACLNTVQFSTHTGYPSIHGSKLPAEEIRALYKGLELNGGVESIAGLLTGYVPGADGILAIKDIAASIHACSPTPALWVLDPVMGDEERGMYVSEEIPPLYKELITHADVITPNQFELGVLAGMEVTDVDSLKRALDTVHTERRVRRIVVTTFRKDEETIWVVGSESAVSTQNNIASQFALEVPYSDCPFQGTGDLFAALLLARLLKKDDMREAVQEVLAAMKPVLRRTEAVFRRGCTAHGITDWRAEKKMGKEGKAAIVCRLAELRIIESASDLMSPGPCDYPIKEFT